MSRIIKSAVALLAVSALPLLAVAPAAAVDFDRLNFTVDCGPEETGEDDHVITASETLVITLANCEGIFIQDFDNTGNVTMTSTGVVTDTLVEIPSGVVTLTITGAANIDLEFTDTESTGPDFDDVDIDVYVADEGADPESALLATEEVSLELSAPELMVREGMIGDPTGDDGTGDVFMGGDENCEVEPGLHVYSTLDFTVLVDGTYDFRAVGVSPIDEDLNWGVAKYPSSDPFVAIYEGFDPSAPEANIIGCNDDGDDTGVAEIDDLWVNGPEAIETPGGFLLHHQWPWFRSDLEPGDYTLVYMPFAAMGSEDFNIGQFDASSDNNPIDHPDQTWEPTEQMVTYEMWGPQDGIEFPEALASTGVDPSFGLWTGLALAGTGVAITVARRRAQRA